MGNGRVEFLCHDSIFFNKSLRSITGHLRADPSSLCIEQVIIIGAALMIVPAIPFKLRNQLFRDWSYPKFIPLANDVQFSCPILYEKVFKF